MIENFGTLMSLVIDFMKTDFTFGSFSFSMFDVLMLQLVFGAVCILIRGFYNE